jgi:hypothetical protein
MGEDREPISLCSAVDARARACHIGARPKCSRAAHFWARLKPRRGCIRSDHYRARRRSRCFLSHCAEWSNRLCESIGSGGTAEFGSGSPRAPGLYGNPFCNWIGQQGIHCCGNARAGGSRHVVIRDPVSKFLPKLTRATEVTIRQLLNHTSGYRDYFLQEYIPARMQRATSVDSILREWAELPLDFLPGTQWQYSGTNYTIAGRIIEEVTGEPYERLL